MKPKQDKIQHDSKLLAKCALYVARGFREPIPKDKRKERKKDPPKPISDDQPMTATSTAAEQVVPLATHSDVIVAQAGATVSNNACVNEAATSTMHSLVTTNVVPEVIGDEAGEATLVAAGENLPMAENQKPSPGFLAGLAHEPAKPSKPLPRLRLTDLPLSKVTQELIDAFFDAAINVPQLPKSNPQRSKNKRIENQKEKFGKVEASRTVVDAVLEQFGKWKHFDALAAAARSLGNAREKKHFLEGTSELIVVTRYLARKFPPKLKESLRQEALRQLELFPPQPK